MSSLLLAAALLCPPGGSAQAQPYYRVWRGAAKPGISARAFLRRLPVFMLKTRAWLSGHGGLAYMPAVPPAGSQAPAELALVVYDSEPGYRSAAATEAGQAYGASHWELFDKSRSRSGAPIAFAGRLLADTPYDVIGGSVSWAGPGGVTRFYLGRLRKADSLEQLAAWVGRAAQGTDGYIIVAGGDGLVASWQHCAQACESGRDARKQRDALLETIMDVVAEPFPGEVEPGHAYQVLLPARAADPMDARVSIRVKDAPLSTYLDMVSSQAGLNFVLADGLEGVRVTAFLTDVTARDALELLRATKGLSYHSVESQGATMIAPAAPEAPQRQTKVYPLQNVPSGE